MFGLITEKVMDYHEGLLGWVSRVSKRAVHKEVSRCGM
jgi:hypothetical protein